MYEIQDIAKDLWAPPERQAHPLPGPGPLIQPLTLFPPATGDNTINHSLRAARWARGGGKWERAQGKGLQLETATAGAASPTRRIGQVLTEDSKGHMGIRNAAKG